MDSYTRDLSEALLAIEAELRSLSLWENEPPSPEDLRSDQPFCCDTLAFPQWLQWILLPRMWDLLERGGPYPSRSGIYAYGEEWALRQGADSLVLLRLVRRFDALIEDRSVREHH
jgi:uncharacterized protein YqcC (DUF446 family)